MSGRNEIRLTPAASGATNARIASHFRRLHTASSMSSPDCCRVSSAIVQSPPRDSLRHQDDVAVAEIEVLLLAGDDLVVVERGPLHGRALRVQDNDARA